MIRELRDDDFSEWRRMREALWPECSESAHAIEMAKIASNSEMAVIVHEDSRGKLSGFTEISIRDRFDGSQSRQVGHLEGWYVDPQSRGQGIGRELACAAERWAATRGCSELTSDTDIENLDSIEAHRKVGFRETGRLVHFIKQISSDR